MPHNTHSIKYLKKMENQVIAPIKSIMSHPVRIIPRHSMKKIQFLNHSAIVN